MKPIEGLPSWDRVIVPTAMNSVVKEKDPSSPSPTPSVWPPIPNSPAQQKNSTPQAPPKSKSSASAPKAKRSRSRPQSSPILLFTLSLPISTPKEEATTTRPPPRPFPIPKGTLLSPATPSRREKPANFVSSRFTSTARPTAGCPKQNSNTPTPSRGTAHQTSPPSKSKNPSLL